MFPRLQNLTILCGIFLIIILIGIKFYVSKFPKEDRIHIGITIKKKEQRKSIQKFFPKLKRIDNVKYIEFTAGWKEFFALQQAGLEPELILEVDKQELIDHQFHTVQQVDSILLAFEKQYRSIMNIEEIGESAFYKLPIRAIKISDLSLHNEDEPAILFTAAHHGNEPLGLEICLYIVEYLCNNYQMESEVKKWIDNLEIWVVPLINPDGYHLVFNNESQIIWRKNLRDNNNDNKFSPEFDGVDLNRNYDYHWGIEGDQFPNSSYYPGLFPFSEPETQAIRELAKRENFVIHLDFHSAGELILYPFKNPLDEKIISTAKQIASKIRTRSNRDYYSVAPLNDNVGQCSLWMYNELGVMSFIVEAGDSYFPSAEQIAQIVEQNARAVFWILSLISDSVGTSEREVLLFNHN